MAYQEEQDTQFTPKASLIDNLVNKYKSLANSLPRDSFIDNLVSDTENDDSSLSGVRRALHELAKANDNYPDRQFKRRRKTQVGSSFEQKLATDCYKLCIFLQGGCGDELSDIFVNHKQSTSELSMWQSQHTVSDNQLHSKTNADIISGMNADIIALRTELLEQKTEYAANNEKHSKIVKDIQSANTKELACLKQELKNCVTENNKLCAELTAKTQICENVKTDFQSQLQAMNDEITQLISNNQELERYKLECCSLIEK